MNKASGSGGFPAELFQILKSDAVEVLHSICQQIWKTQLLPQDWKRSVFITIQKKGKAKECSNYHTIALFSQYQQSNAQKSPSQTSIAHEPRTCRCSSCIQKRQRNQRSNCQHLLNNPKARELQKNIYFGFIDYAKATLFSWAPKLLQMMAAAMKLKDSCSLEEKL